MKNDQPLFIKLGGSVLQEEASFKALCQDIQLMNEEGFKIVLIHGGSKAINAALKHYGIESQFVQGLRQTSSEAMKIIEMVLCGQVNQQLVRMLNSMDLPAVGLSGATQQMLLCNPYNETLGLVGEIVSANTEYLQYLLSAKEAFIPIVASLGVNKEGQALNINADLAAATLANALDAQQLIYITDQEGIYKDQGCLLKKLSEAELEDLIQKGTVKDGMLVKVKAILQALKQGLNHILIANGHKKNILRDAVLYQKHVGTLCIKN